MCGIVGLLQFRGELSASSVEAMTEAVAHRGPDGSGTWFHENIGIGNRRLCIIDPVGSPQPMTTADGAFCITYNGELYNYRALREELKTLGHNFRTNGDTEVVLQAYEEWGSECVKRFRGMFAFGIVDTKKKLLFLARDHFGIKPLVYARLPHGFAFASELGALKILPDFPRTLDRKAIDEYLFLQYIPAPRTAYESARKLPPGHSMQVSFGGIVSDPVPFVRFEFAPTEFRSGGQWLEALSAALEDSVKAHMEADVPFGAFLSGGIDSTVIVSTMSKVLPSPVRTFTIGFHETQFDESPFAAKVAEICRTDHESAVVDIDALGVLPKIVEHMGEPFGDNSIIPTWHLSVLARKSVPMVLSGDGGDEAFSGYSTYRAWTALSAEQRTLKKWLKIISHIGSDWRGKIWKQENRGVVSDRVEIFEDTFAQAKAFSPSNVAQYMDLHTYLPNCILAKVDTASMSHGLEVHTPLIDTEVWKLVLSMPERLNIEELPDGTTRGKLLLRNLLSSQFPPEILDRRKQGFAMPLKRWFSFFGPLRRELRHRLSDRDSPLWEYFEQKEMKQMVSKLSGVPRWLVLVLDEWLRQEMKR